MRRSLAIACVCLFLFCSLVSARTRMFCEADMDNIAVGDEVTVVVVVKPDQIIDTVVIDLLTWDERVLSFVRFERGTLFDDAIIWIEGNVEDGMLEGMCWGSTVPTDEQGVYLSIVFKGVADGTTPISLEEGGIAYAGSDVEFVSDVCIISVGSGVMVYEPVQLPLFLIASIIVLLIAVVIYVVLKVKKK